MKMSAFKNRLFFSSAVMWNSSNSKKLVWIINYESHEVSIFLSYTSKGNWVMHIRHTHIPGVIKPHQMCENAKRNEQSNFYFGMYFFWSFFKDNFCLVYLSLLLQQLTVAFMQLFKNCLDFVKTTASTCPHWWCYEWLFAYKCTPCNLCVAWLWWAWQHFWSRVTHLHIFNEKHPNL